MYDKDVFGDNIAASALQLRQSQTCLGPEGHPSQGLGSAGACCSLSPGWVSCCEREKHNVVSPELSRYTADVWHRPQWPQ